ncbi:o-succinylbenzoate synthase [Shewanella sp. GXUN23E]|uniref:o-succinylbenzoate synthase n=1 Tax=Shewanella sp. GXUN23E TaxID=3422498 RepID=UPI003D7E7827
MSALGGVASPTSSLLASRCNGERTLPTLVLLHGFLGSKDDWQPLLPYLREHFYCIALDLPGHGDSAAISLPTPGFDACSDLIIRTLDSLGVAQFALLGYSLGGRIALHLAQRLSQQSPSRLTALLLESCHPGLQDDAEREARARNDARWAKRLTQEPLTTVLADWYQQPVFADLSDVQKRDLVVKRSQADASELVNCYRATSLALQQDLWSVPDALTCPVVFFAAQRDSKFRALARRWRDQGRLNCRIIAGAGHNIHIEQPKLLAHAIMEQLHMSQDADAISTPITIQSAALYQYRIPLQPMLPVGSARINERQGLVLAIECDDGTRAVTEIAPLSGEDHQGNAFSGFSRESLGQVIAWLQSQLTSLPGQSPDTLLTLSAHTPYPSAALGLSLAAAKLSDDLPAIRQKQRPIPLLYIPDLSAQDLTAQNEAARSETAQSADAISQRAFNERAISQKVAAHIAERVSALSPDVQQVKVKVGQLPMAQEIALIHQILAANPKLKLRLDANRAFTLEQALDFCACLPLDAIEYIEEPCQDPADNIELHQALGILYALDESLNDPDYRFEPAPGLCALVIKPMLTGSLYRLSELILTADAHGVRSVLSSALESSLGINDIRTLAAWLTPTESPGVDTLGAFTQALIAPLADKPCLQLNDLTLIGEYRL